MNERYFVQVATSYGLFWFFRDRSGLVGLHASILFAEAVDRTDAIRVRNLILDTMPMYQPGIMFVPCELGRYLTPAMMRTLNLIS